MAHDPHAGLCELRGVLLAEHAWRQREGLQPTRDPAVTMRRMSGKHYYGEHGDDEGPHPSELVFPGQWMGDDLTWESFFDDGGADCCYCNKPADDPRFTVAIAYRRSWKTWSVGYHFAHIECFRDAMHPSHKPGG